MTPRAPRTRTRRKSSTESTTPAKKGWSAAERTGSLWPSLAKGARPETGSGTAAPDHPGLPPAGRLRRCARRVGRDRLPRSNRPDAVRGHAALQDLRLLPGPGDRADEDHSGQDRRRLRMRLPMRTRRRSAPHEYLQGNTQVAAGGAFPLSTRARAERGELSFGREGFLRARAGHRQGRIAGRLGERGVEREARG